MNDLTYDQRMHRICLSLSTSGNEVILVGRQLKSSLPLIDNPFRQVRLPVFFTKGKFFYLEYNLRLIIFLFFQQFDVVCGIDLDTILPCYLASRIKGKKCVYDAHELFPEVPEVINRPTIKKLWHAVETFIVKRVKNNYTVSSGLAQYFYKSYGKRFEVIRNVPLLKTPHENISGNISNHNSQEEHQTNIDDRYLLYQGALNVGRGLESLIEAMSEIPLKLKIAGEGDLSVSLRQLVNKKNSESRIEFLGRKQGKELSEITEKSFMGLNLLENRGLSYYYSLANKFFDYVMAGVPGITMNFPEYEKLNSEFEVALLIDDLQPATIAAAIRRLSVDKDCYFRLQKNCFRAREQWNWQHEEEKLLSFYDRLQ